MTDDLIPWLHQQLENQRFRAEGLKTMARVLPPETGAYLTETAEMLLADVDAKRRILDAVLPKVNTLQGACDEEWGCRLEVDAADLLLQSLALPYADCPGYQEAWRPA